MFFNPFTREAGRLHPGLKIYLEEDVGPSDHPALIYMLSLLKEDRVRAPEIPLEKWTNALSLIGRHGLSSLVYYHAMRQPTDYQPPRATVEALREAFLKSQMKAIHKENQLGEVLDGFGREDIPVLVLKGPAYAHTLYPSPPMRSYSDIDLLTLPESVPAAREKLIHLGYTCSGRRFDTSRLLYSNEDFKPDKGRSNLGTIELHWDVNPYAGLLRKARISELFRRARPVETDTIRFQTLHPADALIHRAQNICLHHHRDIRLLWIYDGAQLMGRLEDWEMMRQIAVSWLGRLSVEVYIKLAGALTGAGPPAGFDDFEKWPAPTPAERTLWSVVTSRHTGLRPLLKLYFRYAPRKRDLPGAFLSAMFPAPAWMRHKYPPAYGIHLPVAYLRRLWRWMSTGYE